MSMVPITSREYKLILNNDRFYDRERGCQEFWQLIAYLVHKQGGKIERQQNKVDDEELRQTWYVDTPGLALQQKYYILRVRKEENEYKTTLKYRSPDRYLSAAQEVDTSNGKPKFEEDITPPFVSQFSKSASVKTSEPPDVKTLEDVIQLFPGLGQLNLPKTQPVEIVNHFIADEVFRKAGQIKLADREPILKAAFSFWYLPDRVSTYPVVSEFSFSYEAANEDFPVAVVEAANGFFAALQKQSGWFDRNTETKTAYATRLSS